MINIFYSNFGVTPSHEFKALYNSINKEVKTSESDINTIKANLKEYDSENGAFFCEYEVFKNIYRLDVRLSGRSGAAIHLCLLSMRGEDNKELKLKILNTAMEKLKSHIMLSLRRSDTVARYSISQYTMLLPYTTYNAAETVLKRIIKNFYRENPHSKAVLEYSIQSIEIG